MLYEMNTNLFDIATHMHQHHQLDFPPKEICDIFLEPDKRKLMRSTFLHFSDISNPTKPFAICKKWALRIIDEFFLQGDREKELGITVQPLNDREKVNKPYSQVGFIEFFVTPLAAAAVRLMPPLFNLTEQMVLNLHSWHEDWVASTEPTPDPEDQAKMSERIARLHDRLRL